ncbi:MAG TPA: 23S rRNA (adenine(2030)-N(6))-methyltransferase RlmJ [Caulobacteraceae bacterium]
MNYRHAFHAGNFADLVKHAALTLALRELTASPGPLTVIDTHAGAGTYDLTSEMAQRSGEARAGIARLMADPAAPEALAPLKEAVAKLNPQGGLWRYPGSPLLAAQALGPRDRLYACEVHPEDYAALLHALGPYSNAEAVKADGYRAVLERTPDKRRAFVLIDPPFERPDDYEQAARALTGVLRRNDAAWVMIWLPLKDLETFDGFIRRIAPVAPRALIVEARLRPLSDPMTLNGCALVIANPPPDLQAPLTDACEWVVRACGGEGAEVKVWRPSDAG